MKFNHKITCRPPLRACSRLLAAGVVLALLAAPAGAEVPSYIKGTWPPVSTQLTMINGWVVVQGLTLRVGGNQVLWRVPVARTGGAPVSLEHGISTSFVQVGNLQFVIDNATGQTFALQNGQVWRRWPAGVPTEPPQPPVATPSAVAQLAPPPAATPPAIAPPPITQPPAVTPPTAPSTPAMRAVSRHQQALQQVMVANEKLMTALRQLENVRQMHSSGQATAADAQSAQLVVNQARRDLMDAQRVADQTAPPLAVVTPQATVEPTLADLPPDQRISVQSAQDRALQLNLRINNELRQIQTLKDTGGPGYEIARLQQAVDIDQAELSRINGDLTQFWAQARAAGGQPGGLARSGEVSAAQRVIAARETVAGLESEVARLREQQAAGQATDRQLNAAVNKLADAMQKLSDANRDLVAARETTTQPAPEATTMPATAPAAEPAPPAPEAP